MPDRESNQVEVEENSWVVLKSSLVRAKARFEQVRTQLDSPHFVDLAVNIFYPVDQALEVHNIDPSAKPFVPFEVLFSRLERVNKYFDLLGQYPEFFAGERSDHGFFPNLTLRSTDPGIDYVTQAEALLTKKE